MLEYIGNLVVWWHWMVLGLVLLIVEINSGTFLFLGLGLAAMAVGVVFALWDIPFLYQLLLWAGGSVFAVFVWAKWYKNPLVSTAGQSNDGLDAEGIVIHPITPHHRGKVRFDLPVLGDSVWEATARDHLDTGRRVRIVDIHGQIMQVEAIDKTQQQGE